ncbi:MAG: ATP-binding protein [Chloroflexota bacterium]
MNALLRTLLYEWKDRKLPLTLGRDIQVDTAGYSGVVNATVITGFRRVGKTYLLYETIKKMLETYEREDVVYINFEDERIFTRNTDLLTDLISEIQATYGRKPKYLFLDEIQLIPGWSKWARRMLDTEEIQLFITGSSSKFSSLELPTELRGRAWEVHVPPLTFREFLRFKQTTVDFEKAIYVKEEAARFRFLFEEYLIYGGLPAVVLVPQEKKNEVLQSYFQTVVQMDIAERHKVENLPLLKVLLKLLLNSTYFTISKAHNTLKSLGYAVGKSTVDHYISYIESSYFMKEMYFHAPSVVNQVQRPRKLYFIDNGFITALSTQYSKNMGRLLENVVFHRLSQIHKDISYYKDSRDYEVDFVVCENGKVIDLYQVCFDLADEETRAREIRSLVKAGAALHCPNLHLLYMDKPDEIEFPAGIQAKSMLQFLA